MNRASIACVVWAALSVLLISCETRDPGLEEEVSRLRQENGELKARLESAEQAAIQASSQVNEQTAAMREQIEAARAALQEMESRFDRKRLEASFAAAVSDFKEETLKKFPGNTISQVTLHQMVMPSDHPFSSGVTLVLDDDAAGTSRTIHLKALGNIEGDWTFKKVEADAMAGRSPEAGAPPVSPERETATAGTSSSDGASGGSSSGAGGSPRPPVIRRTGEGGGQTTGGRVYRIDWGD